MKSYWKIVKLPVYVLIGWSIIGLIIASISFDAYQSIFTPTTGWILALGAFGFIGWTTFKDHKKKLGDCAKAGAVAGTIAGFAGAILGIIMFYSIPGIIDAAMQQATLQGVDEETVRGYMQVGVYVGLIIGPLINAALGAIISFVVGFIASKTQ